MTPTILNLSRNAWEVYKVEKIPAYRSLRSNAKNGYRIHYYECHDRCGFKFTVKTYSSDVPLQIVFNNIEAHTTPIEQSKKTKMNSDVKESIINILNQFKNSKNIGAKKILSKLRASNVPERLLPTNRQISNFIAYYRKTHSTSELNPILNHSPKTFLAKRHLSSSSVLNSTKQILNNIVTKDMNSIEI
ncbi:hypothetical protein BC833DRAFT_617655 [Globomyces pollinis-pini]|nr:hypothetical protein BC833DRAFT_617655 [Globomyces pollinis-pini]